MPGGERGSGTLLAAAGALFLAVVAGLLVLLACGLAAAHSARAAADLAALSAAAEQVSGRSPCAAARAIAEANRTRLVECRVTGDSLDFVVSVRVAAPLPGGWPGVPAEVGAAAHAGRAGLAGVVR